MQTARAIGNKTLDPSLISSIFAETPIVNALAGDAPQLARTKLAALHEHVQQNVIVEVFLISVLVIAGVVVIWILQLRRLRSSARDHLAETESLRTNRNHLQAECCDLRTHLDEARAAAILEKQKGNQQARNIHTRRLEVAAERDHFKVAPVLSLLG